VLFLVWRVLASLTRRRQDSSWAGAEDFSRFSARRRDRRQRFRTEPGPEQPPEELVACSVCGTMVPMRRALPSSTGEHYCSERCRRGSGR
jgi:hypothetical protein